MAMCESQSESSSNSILWTFLVSFHPLVTFTFPKCKFGKTSMISHCASTLGLVNGNGSIDSKDRKLSFAMFVFQLWNRKRCRQDALILHNISIGFNYWKDGTIRFASYIWSIEKPYKLLPNSLSGMLISAKCCWNSTQILRKQTRNVY